jgi:hypothetical protein
MYSIYHIPGVKIGCSIQFEKRIKEQGFDNCEIIEEHIDIYTASDREQELQKQYGYKVDRRPYWQTVSLSSKAGKIGGKIGGKINKQNKTGLFGMTDIAKHKACMKGGKITAAKLSIPVFAFEYNTNKFIGEFNSQLAAAKYLNLFSTHIVRVLKGKQTHTGGYTFKYKQQ